MDGDRRALLRGVGVAFAGVTLAGCSGDIGGGLAAPTADGESTAREREAGAVTAVAAEWTVVRARLHDALSLGAAGAPGAGAAVVDDVAERFAAAGGEWSPREQLAATHGGLADAVTTAFDDVRAALSSGDVAAARDAVAEVENALESAQIGRTDPETAGALSLAVRASRARNVGFLAACDALEAAAGEADRLRGDVARTSAGEALESAGEAYTDGFADALSEAATAAEGGDAGAVRERAREAAETADDAVYGVLGDRVGGVVHLAGLQAAGRDAPVAARLGGPTADFGHAAVLNGYRARVADAVRLFERGAGDAASGVVEGVFAEFEGARAHGALEEGAPDAYERFEAEGLSELAAAVDADDAEAVRSAAEATHEGLVAGIASLAGPTERALLASGFFRARLGDVRELLARGETEAAGDAVTRLFQRFETNEAGFHETLEETDESLYRTFEHEHLEALGDALAAGDESAAETHLDGAQGALLDFERRVGTVAHVAGAEACYLTGRAFDAAAAALDDADRGESVVTDAFAFFESGAGGFHEALEEADEERYRAFERALTGVGDAVAGDESASGGGASDPFAAAASVGEETARAVYAVVGASGGAADGAVASLGREAAAAFERAPVADLLESTAPDAHESLTSALDRYVSALEGDGGDVDAAVRNVADAALAAEFALAGAPDATPEVSGGESGGESRPEVTGGPDVVDGVPEDVDHVVEMTAVAFEPAELQISAGDTVAWVHEAGEAHTVTAYEDGVPGGATYWASGGYENESAAREGWEDERRGGVGEGRAYVHTFETAGTHRYCCLPHEPAGMVGTVVVEE